MSADASKESYQYSHIRLKKRLLTVYKKTYRITKSTLHFHDAHEILIIEQGKFKVYAPQFLYEGEGPCIVFFKLGTYHGAVRSDCESLPYVFHVMNFRQSLLDGMPQHPICIDRSFEPSVIVIPVEKKDIEIFTPLLERLEALSKTYTEELPMPPLMHGYFAAVLNYIYELIISNKSIAFDSEGDDENYISGVIKEALEAISRGESVTASDLADRFHVSGTKLSRDFYKVVGISVKQMIDALRLDRVKSLLREGRSNVEVAELCGFSSGDYLIQFFDRHMNMSPGEYRRQNRGKA